MCRYTVFTKTFKYHRSEKVKFSINFNKVIKVLISLTLKVISPLHKKNTGSFPNEAKINPIKEFSNGQICARKMQRLVLVNSYTKIKELDSYNL